MGKICRPQRHGDALGHYGDYKQIPNILIGIQSGIIGFLLVYNSSVTDKIGLLYV